MTLRERLQTIGLAIQGKPVVKTKEVIKEIEKVNKSLAGGFLDYSSNNVLGNYNSVSSKVLQANKGWVYRNNDVIAKEVATIEFELYSTRVVGQELQFNQITSHPILDALDKFNPFTSASDGFYVTQSHKKLAGNAYWYIEGNGPNVSGIYVLPADKVEILTGKVGTVIEITGYKYQDSVGGKPIKITYGPDEVIHFKVPNPSNPIKGLGAVEALADDIDLDTLATEANKQMFRRGLIGSFVLTTELSMSPEQVKELRAELTSSFTGVENAFKIPIFSGGLKPNNIQMSNRDMQFNDLQTWVRDKITSGFGNSKAVIGVTDDVNRANAEATITNWKQTTIRAEMKQITDTLNEFFVPRFGTNLILGFANPVPEDSTEEDTRATELYSAKLITKNEARELIDYPPVKEGDSFPDPNAGLIPITEVPKAIRNVSYTKYLRKHYDYIKQYKAIKKVTDKMARKMIDKKKKKAFLSSEQIATYYSKQIQLVEVYEERFRQKIEKFINQLVDKAVSNVPKEVRDMQNKALFDDETEILQATLDFEPLLNEIAQAAGTEAMNLIKSNKPYLGKNIRPLLKKRVDLFAKSMIETDKNKLIDIIANGVRDGLSVPQIKNEILQSFDEYSKMQAERITRTEVINASNQAALDAWQESGIVEGKQWLTAPGADEECAEYEGQIVYNLSGNFFSPENEFQDGDPPIHPNCRCVVLPVVEEFSQRNLKKTDKK